MKQQNELHIIEKSFALNDIKIGKLFAWPLLRQRVYFEIIKSKLNYSSKLRTRNKLQLIKNFFYGLTNLFKLKKFDYIFFNNADKRKLVLKNKQYDVFFDSWADKLGQDKSLFVEWAIDKHFPANKTHSKHVISDLFFKYCCFLATLFSKIKIENSQALEDLKKEYNIQFDEGKELKERKGELLFYRLFFRIVKPKAVFLISSFTKVPIVIAAHLENVKVYEAQHGYIGDNHQFYNSHYNFEQLYYPDFLIGFGAYEKKQLPKDFIFQSSQILTIGSLHLEDIKINFNSDILKTLKSKYDKVFCVSLQTVKEEALLTWVMQEASLHSNWLFIIQPKNATLDYSQYTSIENCMVLPEYNTYQVLKYSDYNITIYSTTAVEATFFGVKTLFFNIDGLSVKYFDVNKMYASIINTKEKLDANILSKTQDEQISYFLSDYYKNVSLTPVSI